MLIYLGIHVVGGVRETPEPAPQYLENYDDRDPSHSNEDQTSDEEEKILSQVFFYLLFCVHLPQLKECRSELYHCKL